MEAPTFDYRNMPANNPNRDERGGEAPRVIESASASTAPQENSSNFAYILTGIVLGVMSLIVLAFGLLMFAVAGSAYDMSTDYGDALYTDEYEEWERFEREHRDELDQFEEELWNEYLGEIGLSA